MTMQKQLGINIYDESRQDGEELNNNDIIITALIMTETKPQNKRAIKCIYQKQAEKISVEKKHKMQKAWGRKMSHNFRTDLPRKSVMASPYAGRST